MTPAELLRAVGVALYGEQWQNELGRDLDVNPRQIRRWLAGQYDPKPGVWAELSVICEKRASDIGALLREIKRLKE